MSTGRKLLTAAIVGTLAVSTVTALAGPAQAATGEAGQISAAISKATAGMGAEVATSDGGATVAARASAHGVTVELPRRASDAISVRGDGIEVKVGLPAHETAQAAVRTSAGTVVYPDPASSASAAAQALDGSARALVTIRDAKAPTEYRFPLALPTGTALHQADDGSIAIVQNRGTASVFLGYLAAPWAKDANGNAIKTSYRVDGTTVVQTIEHHGATYPVVADPTYWWGARINMSSTEANQIAAALAAGAGVSGIVAIFAAGTIAGIPGAVVYGVAAGILAIGSAGFAFLNAAGRGVTCEWWWVGGFHGCWGR